MPKWVFTDPDANQVSPQELSDDLGAYATVAAVQTGLARKQDIGNYATVLDLAGKQDKGDYATLTDLDSKQDRGDYATNTAVQGKQDKGDYATAQDLAAGLASKQPTGSYAQAADVAAYTVQTDATLSSVGSRLDAHDTQLSNVISVNTAQTSTMNSHETRITNNETTLAGLGSLSTKNSLSFAEITNRPTIGLLASKDSLSYAEVTGTPALGTLASQNTVDYNTDVINKPDVSAGAAGAPAAFRNLLTNGHFAIQNRNKLSGVNWVCDRWSIISTTMDYNTSTGSGTYPGADLTRVGPTANGRINPCLTTTYGAFPPPATECQRLCQIIEARDIYDLHWADNKADAPSLTLSFWAFLPIAGTYCACLRQTTYDPGYSNASYQSYVATYTYTTPLTWQYVTLTFPPPPSLGTNWWSPGMFSDAPGMEVSLCWQGGGSAKATTTPNTWLNSATLAAAPVVAKTQTNAAQARGINVRFALVQLEVGTTATPFEYRLRSIEEELCRRYYTIWLNTGTTSQFFMCMGYINDASSAIFVLPLPTPMRGPPALASQNAFVVYNPAKPAAATPTSIAIQPGAWGNNAFALTTNVTGGAQTSPGSVALLYMNSTTTWLALDADYTFTKM